MKRILVVDDDKALRDCLRAILELNGFTVSLARDGVEAMRMVERSAFDIGLIDILLPEKGGWEIIPEIRQTRPNMALIVMTGGGPFPPKQLLRVGRYFGADGALEKPFKAEQLLEVIDAILSDHALDR